MNIHEHQAKQILKQFGAVVPEGVFGFTVEELLEKSEIYSLIKQEVPTKGIFSQNISGFYFYV